MEEDDKALENQPSSAIDPSDDAYLVSAIKEPFDEARFKRIFSEHLDALATKHQVDSYTIIYLLDGEDSLSSWHSDRVYKAASKAPKEKDILLIVHSPGGSIESGYLIAKTCKRLSKEHFVVAVPRKAKSAATLLALGADQIHMGLLSQLGPIDPQFGGLPALGMKNALEILSDLACRYPGASQMLSEYISDKLDLRILGYFERANESAGQYAERLLTNKSLPQGRTPASLATHFVNHYKDHGFVIDYDEAEDLLGADLIKKETKEYKFSNAVYQSFEFAEFLLRVIVGDKALDIVGQSNEIRVFTKKREG